MNISERMGKFSKLKYIIKLDVDKVKDTNF